MECPYVDPNRLIAIGSSLGAYAAFVSASEDHRIRAVCAIGAPSDITTYRMDEKVMEAVFIPWLNCEPDADSSNKWHTMTKGLTEAHSPLHHIGRIAPRPVLLICGQNDVWTPLMYSEQLYHCAREPRELVIVPDANHYLSWHRHALIDVILRWIRRAGGTPPSFPHS
jgi:dipeptidyl aminopeptidase/acylaminoacyl peptidase